LLCDFGNTAPHGRAILVDKVPVREKIERQAYSAHPSRW
jgi:hypothetical protein